MCMFVQSLRLFSLFILCSTPPTRPPHPLPEDLLVPLMVFKSIHCVNSERLRNMSLKDHGILMTPLHDMCNRSDMLPLKSSCSIL